LFPNGLDFEYKFINGVNLIVGGNGMGKTSLVNVIKYSIIGHYKEGFDFTRTYLGNKIEKRIPHPWNYFKKRMDESIEIDSSPKVKIKYLVNGTPFEVVRAMDEIKILSVSVDNMQLNGTLIDQYEYDRLFYEYSRESDISNKNRLFDTLKSTLPFIFEKTFEKFSNMQFDDLIFFVNKILFLGEDHRTILWNNDQFNDVQTELFNKYFNDRVLNTERQEANRQAKYFDTQARHKSEDIRVIKKVLENVEVNKSTGQPKTIREKIEALRISKENISERLTSLQDLRKESDKELKILSNKINELSLEIAQLEANQKMAEKEALQRRWISLHKNYDLYVKSLSANQICPLCSNELDEGFIKKKISNDKNCILCDQLITVPEEVNTLSDSHREKITASYTRIREFQNEVYVLESKLHDLDKEFQKYNQELREINSELRNLEFDLVKSQNDTNASGDNLQAFYDEIAKLEIEKDEFQEKSRNYKERSQEIYDKIEKEILFNALSFSSLFSGYAEKFLGVKCSLTYDDINGQKRFYPVIDGKIREQEEELSESQRFFVDHSFRMSILSFFYKNPSFYMVETPDSSLDISYERNAADVFIEFLKNPYCLILTTNINNSEFLNYLAKHAKNVSIINLLDIGKKSSIQNINSNLNSILKKVQNNINERKDS
jgi:hypothetical protein